MVLPSCGRDSWRPPCSGTWPRQIANGRLHRQYSGHARTSRSAWFVGGGRAHHNSLGFSDCCPSAWSKHDCRGGRAVANLAVRHACDIACIAHKHDQHHHHQGHSHDHAHTGQPRQANEASSADIVWFGFSGGLLPCPAAIAVLLVCIQIKQFALGIAMVAAFTIGLAATLVAIGLTASWAAKKASTTWPWLDRMTQRLPYLSAGIVMILGLVMTAFGLQATWSVGQRRPN